MPGGNPSIPQGQHGLPQSGGFPSPAFAQPASGAQQVPPSGFPAPQQPASPPQAPGTEQFHEFFTPPSVPEPQPQGQPEASAQASPYDFSARTLADAPVYTGLGEVQEFIYDPNVKEVPQPLGTPQGPQPEMAAEEGQGSSRPGIITMLSFYLVFYVISMLVLALGYDFAQQYAKPIAAFIFPIAGNNSLLKSLLITTCFYWGMVILSLFVFRKK